MPILGNIIKSTIEITDKVLPESSPVEQQKKVLIKLLKKAKGTAFGQQYAFHLMPEQENITTIFAENVPYHDYEAMHKDWWKRQLEGEEDVTWPGKPNFYAQTSGTTGNGAKRIPVTDDMLDSIRKAGIKQVMALANFDMSPEFFEKEVLMLGSCTDLEKVGDHLEGEISGISATNIPNWFKGFYRPGDEIAQIKDWDERIDRIIKEAPKWDIGALSGIPSWIELMLKRIVKHYQLDTIHDIWPNLEAMASGGVAFQPYEKSFNKLLIRPLKVVDTYLASEGFIAYQARDVEDLSMRLITDGGIFFEFVPFEDKYIGENGEIKQGARSLTLDEVEEDKDYALVVTTNAGAWRYMIGDTIKFTNKELAEIIITGRTKHFLNVVGSQLSVLKMNRGMQHLEEKFDLTIPEFTVSATRPDGENYIHHWFIGTNDKNVDEDAVANELDKFLQDINKNYNKARSNTLTGVKVTAIEPDMFQKWNAYQKKKGGQVKMPRVMKEEQLEEWKDFISKER